MSERQYVVPVRKTRMGWTIATVHHSLHPHYAEDAAWIKALGENERAMEVEIDWSRASGVRIYQDFRREMHVSLEPLEWDPQGVFRLGWDVPGTPACIISQINPYGQLCLLSCVTCQEDEEISVWHFGARVAEHLRDTYAEPAGLDLADLSLVHVGDPAGRNKPGVTAKRHQETRSAWDTLRLGSRLYLGEDARGNPLYEEKKGWGWHFHAGAMDNQTRQEAVRDRLTRLVPGGYPALVVDKGQDRIIQMFYSYRKKEFEDGSVSREPLKDIWSHLANALEYLCTKLSVQPPERHSGFEEDRPRREPVRSIAAGRR